MPPTRHSFRKRPPRIQLEYNLNVEAVATEVRPKFRTRQCDRVHVSFWSQRADRDDVLKYEQTMADDTELLLLVVSATARLSTHSARMEASRLVREREGRLVAVAVTLEGGGFWRSGLRAMFTGIAMLSPLSVRWRAFDSVSDAAAWLATQSSAVAELDLDATVNQLR